MGKTESVMPHREIFEYVAQTKPTAVDRESRTISNVKILGRYARDDSGRAYREYSRQAIESAKRLYSKLPVNSDHPGDGNPYAVRSIGDRLGWLGESFTVKWDGGDDDGLYGELHVFESAKNGKLVLESAESASHVMGCSHNASCNVTDKPDGVEFIDDIVGARSVDIVTTPGTTRGFFESRRENKKVKTTIRQILATRKEKVTDELTPLLEQMGEDAALAGMPMEVAEVDSKEAVREAFKAAINAIIDDDALDLQATIGKIRDMLKAQEKMLDSGNESTDDESGEEESGDTGAMESRQKSSATEKLVARLEAAERRANVSDALSSYGLTRGDVTAEKIAVLEKQNDVDSMRAIIEEWPPVDRIPKTQRQRSSVSELLGIGMGCASRGAETYDAVKTKLIPADKK